MISCAQVIMKYLIYQLLNALSKVLVNLLSAASVLEIGKRRVVGLGNVRYQKPAERQTTSILVHFFFPFSLYAPSIATIRLRVTRATPEMNHKVGQGQNGNSRTRSGKL
jgi:hypothetical protein